MKHTKQHFDQTLQGIPAVKLKSKLRKTLTGVLWVIVGVVLYQFKLGPGWLPLVTIGLGGFMLSGDLIKSATGLFKASAKDVGEGIKSIKDSIS